MDERLFARPAERIQGVVVEGSHRSAFLVAQNQTVERVPNLKPLAQSPLSGIRRPAPIRTETPVGPGTRKRRSTSFTTARKGRKSRPCAFLGLSTHRCPHRSLTTRSNFQLLMNRQACHLSVNGMDGPIHAGPLAYEDQIVNGGSTGPAHVIDFSEEGPHVVESRCRH